MAGRKDVRSHTAESMAAAALEALAGRETVTAIARRHGATPRQVARWKKQLQQQAAAVFADASPKKPAADEHIYRHVVQGAGWGIAVGSPRGERLTWVNPAYAEMHGYTQEELIGAPIATVYAAETRPRVKEVVRRANRAGQNRFETLHRRKDGTVFPVFVDARAVRNADGTLYGRIVHVQDISDFSRIRERLRVSNEFLTAIFENAPISLAVCDMDGRYIRVNPAMCRMLGYSEAELLTMGYRDVTHPDDVAANDAGRARLVEQGGGEFHMEKRYVCKDGTCIWALMVVSAVLDAKGRPLYTIGQMMDIDAQKRMQTALIEREAALLQSRLRIRELAARQERRIEEERKRIAREVHDELGQMATLLKLDIALLKRQLGAPGGEVEDLLAQMGDMADKAVAVARTVASNLRPAVLDLGLVPAIQWLANDFSRRDGMDCRVDVSARFPRIDDASSTVLFRVVQECLTNAARHAGAGHVGIELRRRGGWLRLAVRDDGRGFDREKIRLHSGFGLMGMRERVLALGGTVRIESAPGEGTAVLIRIPLQGEAP